MNLKPLVIIGIMMVILGEVTMRPNIFPDRAGAWGKVKSIQLPEPIVEGKVSLEEAIKKRRSKRRFDELDFMSSKIDELK